MVQVVGSATLYTVILTPSVPFRICVIGSSFFHKRPICPLSVCVFACDLAATESCSIAPYVRTFPYFFAGGLLYFELLLENACGVLAEMLRPRGPSVRSEISRCLPFNGIALVCAEHEFL